MVSAEPPQNRSTTNKTAAPPPRNPASPPTPPPLFADRAFEAKLLQFAVSEVASCGRLPPDAAIRARAQELSGFEVWQAAAAPTPVDDLGLLAAFKARVVDRVKAVLGGPGDDRAVGGNRGRGSDVVDPGLLPAEGLGGETRSTAETRAKLHVAISESRLDEIITETLQR